MPRRKKEDHPAPVGEKRIWHPYDMQSLVQRKFIVVVNKILHDEYVLLDVSHCARTLEFRS